MRHMLASLASSLFLVASSAYAQTPSGPAGGGGEIWDLSDPSAARHWFTGLRCWDSAAGASFIGRTAYRPTGADVSCNYRAPDTMVTVYATQRELYGVGMQEITEQAREILRGRYDGVRTIADGSRTLATSSGEIDLDEFLLAVDGRDVQSDTSMQGITGVWHVDVSGWILKLRLTSYGRPDIASMRATANALLSRAFEQMDTARACASAGRVAAPDLQITEAESINVQVGVGALGAMLVEQALPTDAAAARASGFVCLGQSLVSRSGAVTISVLPIIQQAAPQTDAGAVTLLALGEVYGAETSIMAGVFDMSMNPFGVDGQRTDRGHFIFARNDGTTGFYGALPGGVELYRSGAHAAVYVADGGVALVSSSRREDEL